MTKVRSQYKKPGYRFLFGKSAPGVTYIYLFFYFFFLLQDIISNHTNNYGTKIACIADDTGDRTYVEVVANPAKAGNGNHSAHLLHIGSTISKRRKNLGKND